MDVHREFAQLAVVESGLVRGEGRIGVTPEALLAWAAGLRGDDQVALEATVNSDAIANLLAPLVARVVVSNPSKTRAIAEAKVKTDKVDARILAQLLAADFLPPVWLPDERTRRLRRQVARRAHIVRQRTRMKNQVHAILARNLAPTPPVSDLFGTTRRWRQIRTSMVSTTALSCLVPVASMAEWLTSRCGALISVTSSGQRKRPGRGCPESNPAWATPSATPQE
jgi:transposase